MNDSTRISMEISDDELSELTLIEISPCPCCDDRPFTLEEALWSYGEKQIEFTHWIDTVDTVAFGCPRCDALGPASGNRIQAVWGWNVLVHGSAELKSLYKSL